MQQVERKTEQGVILFVDIKFDPYYPPMVINESNSSYLIYKKEAEKGYKTIRHKLPLANWQLIGLTSEVTELQAMNMLDYQSDNDEHQSPIWKDYVTGVFGLSPIPSFKSLIQHEDIKEPSVVLFNPRINMRKSIEKYIEWKGYTWTYETIMSAYEQYKKGHYVSFTAKDVINNVIKPNEK